MIVCGQVHANPDFKKGPYLPGHKNFFKIPDFREVADTTIRGRITDSSDAPLSGVSILVKGTNVGTFTNASGDFVLPGVNARATLVISNVGYQSYRGKIVRRANQC